MSETLISALCDAIMPILTTVLMAVLTYIGNEAKKIYKEHINTKEKEEIAKNTVQYVEQVFSTLKGSEKLEKAKETAVNWLNEKGITISDAELTVLIESSVKALKGGFYTDEKTEEEE